MKKRVNLYSHFVIPSLCLTILFFIGCIPKNLFGENDKLFFKEIKKPGIKLEWFYCSTITFVTADSVKVFSDSLNISKTLCVSDNIADIYITENIINIAFYGKPKLNEDTISLPDSIFGYPIAIDTNKILSNPVFRRYYKKKD